MTGEERTDMEWFVEILKTLAHEIVHVKQYVLGELKSRDVGLVYKGIKKRTPVWIPAGLEKH